MNKTIRSLFFECSLLLIAEALQVRAGVAYSDPPGGWTYIYNGDQLIVADDVIDTRVTLTLRARIPTTSNTTSALDPLHRDGQQVAGVQPYPPEGDGYVTSDGGKGNFVVSQRLGGAIPTNGAIAFSLTQT